MLFYYIIENITNGDMNTIDPNIKYPENIRKIITGRSTTEDWLKNNFTYEVFKYIKQNEIDRCKKLWRQFYEN